MTCNNCGERMVGDGYTTVIHCPNLDLIGEGYEPDANPVHCTEANAMTLHLTFNDRAETFDDVPRMALAEAITDRHPDALLAVYDDGELDLILRSPGRDIAFQRFDLALEWREGAISDTQLQVVDRSFYALDRDHARVIARNISIDEAGLYTDVDMVLTDDEGEEVHL